MLATCRNHLTISGQFKEEKGEGEKDSKDYKGKLPPTVHGAHEAATDSSTPLPHSPLAVTERSFGSFTRSIPVSPGLKESDIQAKMEDGLLTLEFPKVEAPSAKKIEIA